MSIRLKVIAKIQADLTDRFRVVDNTGNDKKVIAGQFPDIILYGKEEALKDTLAFIMKVENGNELVDSLSAWKELSGAPVGFYIIVPQKKLDEARKLTNATGIKARFGWYSEEGENVTQIEYD